MKSTTFRLFPALSLAACMAVSQNAHADWTFTSSASSYTATVSGDPSVSLSGVYAANTSGVMTGAWTAGTLSPYSGGMGMTTGGETGTNQPGHALDNTENTEGVLLNFGTTKIALTQIGLGYTAQCVNSSNVAVGSATNGSCPSNTTLKTGTSEDMSLFRWVGTGSPTGSNSLIGKTATGMTGWELVGNYGSMPQDSSSPYTYVNGSGLSSSWWLITAYNSALTNTTTKTANTLVDNGTVDNGNDFFKLYAVAGTNCTTTNCGGGGGGSAPEPGSLALAGLALFGLAYTRRQFSDRRG